METIRFSDIHQKDIGKKFYVQVHGETKKIPLILEKIENTNKLTFKGEGNIKEINMAERPHLLFYKFKNGSPAKTKRIESIKRIKKGSEDIDEVASKLATVKLSSDEDGMAGGKKRDKTKKRRHRRLRKTHHRRR
jgi:hypothetical protein